MPDENSILELAFKMLDINPDQNSGDRNIVKDQLAEPRLPRIQYLLILKNVPDSAFYFFIRACLKLL